MCPNGIRHRTQVKGYVPDLITNIIKELVNGEMGTVIDLNKIQTNGELSIESRHDRVP